MKGLGFLISDVSYYFGAFEISQAIKDVGAVRAEINTIGVNNDFMGLLIGLLNEQGVQPWIIVSGDDHVESMADRAKRWGVWGIVVKNNGAWHSMTKKLNELFAGPVASEGGLNGHTTYAHPRIEMKENRSREDLTPILNVGTITEPPAADDFEETVAWYDDLTIENLYNARQMPYIMDILKKRYKHD